jgi:hypothetical protein
VSPLPDAQFLKPIKKTFQDSMTSESLKVKILTVLPKSWSTQEIQEVVPSASNYII